jgi:wobble nucleotide-excising tRNase
MLKKIQLIRNVGCFESFAGSALGDLGRLVLIYAENGRGKTTISSILSSLANNDASIVNGRKRLGSQNDPHVVLDIEGQTTNVMFQSGQWNVSHDNIYIYDDEFINQNVFSGLEVSASHRQKLHEIILGRAGVSLARRVQELSQQISDCSSTIREISSHIPTDQRFGFDITAFCNLEEIEDVEGLITEQEKNFQAISQADAVASKNLFTTILLPGIDEVALAATLSAGLPDIDAVAMQSIRDHFSLIGENAETWVSDGVGKIINTGDGQERCPFCAQVIDGIDLISKYRSYFSDAYDELTRSITTGISNYSANFSGDNLSSKQAELTGFIVSLYEFWNKFIELPETEIDWQEFSTAWQEARDAVLSLLQIKNSSPLAAVEISAEIKAKIDKYLSLRVSIIESIETLISYNGRLEQLKEKSSSGSLADVETELKRLKATHARYSEQLRELCDGYQKTSRLRSLLETQKQVARDALDTHRSAVFSQYHTSINKHLELFGANFRIGGLESSNAAGRPSTTYNVLINEYQVPLASQDTPCFKNTLSAGDRNTLGLAFFFASLETEPDLQDSIVVLDDPMSSLDDGRTMTTIQKIRDLIPASSQLIALCHSRRFLCDIWEHSDKDNTTALKISRGSNNTSTISSWDVSSDSLTEYDKRHKVLRDHVDADKQDKRYVAQCLRPVMEKYLRIVFPDYYTPGTLLGNFRNHVENLRDNGLRVMSDDDINELRNITEYANKYHHDTNPAWETEEINDTELLAFAKRVINFTSHTAVIT